MAQEENNFQEKSDDSDTTQLIQEDIPLDSTETVAEEPIENVADTTESKREKRQREKEAKPPRVKTPPDTLARPTVGIGIGLVAFDGDVKSNENKNLPLSGGLGTQLTVSQILTPSFNMNLSLMFSRLSANERSLQRNVNFQTQLFTAGMNLQYNFKNFFPGHRTIVPYISVGLEVVEFSTKTDLIDAYGNTYNYWSDGTIRNVDENSPNAEESILLSRDYVYETDIRDKRYSGGQDFDERAIGLPVGVGANISLTSKIDFGFSWMYHFTNTDDIDGINANSPPSVTGTRGDNGRNDNFWYLSANLSYNFTRSATGKMEIRDQWSVDDLMAFGEDDYDGDGIMDFMDECPQTPFGVEVDERGCPLNPDRPAMLTDSQIYERYLTYMDSTGLYTKIEKRAFSSTDKRRLVVNRPKKSFKIKSSFYEDIFVHFGFSGCIQLF